MSTTLATFITNLSTAANDIESIVVTVAVAFLPIAALFLGIRYLLRAAKVVK